MGIKEQTLICLMNINKNLSEIANELKKLNANNSKKQRIMKDVSIPNTARDPRGISTNDAAKVEAMKELFNEYVFGKEGDKSGE